jgi:hypothetical protein
MCAFEKHRECEENPIGQTLGVPREHIHQRIAPGLAGFIYGMNQHQIPLPAAVPEADAS